MKHEELSIWCIQWEDACSGDPWSTEMDTNLAWVVTIGTLVKENDEVVQLALNVDTTNDAISCAINIPKVNIKSRKKICRLMDLKKKKTTR